ncbi:MAG: AzlD domain-containing protein [Oscillospiraceae bacterium]|nr:AzlD domain-containing protein [Oscillospiraceae bacterium]
MDNSRAILAICIMAGITFILRSMSFVLFTHGKTPKYISFLGKYLPFSIIGMLVIYCLKNVSLIRSPYGIPEIVAVALVALLHLWKRNTLLSILVGTVSYMLLLHLF